MCDITIVFPVYNKKNSIRAVYQITCKTITKAIGTSSYELIFVNDASTDNSESIIESLVKEDSQVKLINHRKNMGQVKALQTGLLSSNGNVVFFATCDLQNPLDSIEPIYKAIVTDGYDLGIAFRAKHMDKSWQSVLSRAYFRFLKAIFPNFPFGGFDYVGMHHSLSDRLRTINFERILIQLELLRLSKRTFFYPIVRSSDLLDSSGWTFGSKVRYGMRFFHYLEITQWKTLFIFILGLITFGLVIHFIKV